MVVIVHRLPKDFVFHLIMLIDLQAFSADLWILPSEVTH